MTASNFLSLLDTIKSGVDPSTGEVFDKGTSCLKDPKIKRELNRFTELLSSLPTGVEIDLPDATISEACAELRSLGYQPTVAQLAKVFIGSRSIVDRNLKALSSYNRYRGVYSRPSIHKHLMGFHRRNPEILSEFVKRSTPTVDEPWRVIDFFTTVSFDKLEDEKEHALSQSVLAIGIRKQADRLPKYMLQARQNYPRAFEPWSREEQALLIEAMCYTNDLGKLAGIFGRSERSVEATGQRLIWESQQKSQRKTTA